MAGIVFTLWVYLYVMYWSGFEYFVCGQHHICVRCRTVHRWKGTLSVDYLLYNQSHVISLRCGYPFVTQTVQLILLNNGHNLLFCGPLDHLSNNDPNPLSSEKVILLFCLTCVVTANIKFASLAAADSSAVVVTSYWHTAYVILLIILSKQCNRVRCREIFPTSGILRFSWLNAWKCGWKLSQENK